MTFRELNEDDLFVMKMSRCKDVYRKVDGEHAWRTMFQSPSGWVPYAHAQKVPVSPDVEVQRKTIALQDN